jgi:hypothetical protein
MMSNKGTTVEYYKKAGEYLKNMADRSGGRMYQASTGANLVDAFRKSQPRCANITASVICQRKNQKRQKT